MRSIASYRVCASRGLALLALGLHVTAASGCQEEREPGRLERDLGLGERGVAIDALVIPDRAVIEGDLEDAEPDATRQDAGDGATGTPDGGPELIVGKPCRRGAGLSDCGPAPNTCIVRLQDGRGFCSLVCTPDDPATREANEDDCPAGSHCAKVGANRWCLRSCTPALGKQGCPASYFRCDPITESFLPTKRRVALCYELACTSDRSCPVAAGESCTGDGECQLALKDPLAFCATTDTSGARCALPGRCDLASGLCAPHDRGKAGAKIGDPCVGDLDCTNGGSCLRELTKGGSVAQRNGYCTVKNCAFAASLPSYECPSGAICTGTQGGGLCMKACDPARSADCRNVAKDTRHDYDCYDFSRVSITGTIYAIATWPVCYPALSCSSGAANCASFAPVGNKLNMQCIDPETDQPTADPGDPAGRCLDDTRSAP